MIKLQSTDIPVTCQAKLLIEQMPDINMEEVQDWYISQLMIGDRTIVEYLIHKSKK